MAFVRMESALAVIDETGLCLTQEHRDRERTWWRLSRGEDMVRFTAESNVIPSPDPSTTDITYLFKVDGPYAPDLHLGADRSREAIQGCVERALLGWLETSPANRGLRVGVAFEYAS